LEFPLFESFTILFLIFKRFGEGKIRMIHDRGAAAAAAQEEEEEEEC
jgi:hypothetical protein